MSPSAVQAAEPDTRLPLRHAERPLTMPDDLFDVRFGAGYTRLADRFDAMILSAGAGYGVNDDLEVGLVLLRVSLSEAPGTGLDNPTGYAQLRLLRGPLQISILGELELPVGSGIDFSVRVPSLVQIARLVRLDFTPSVYAQSGSKWRWAAAVPVVLAVQITDHLWVGGAAALELPDLRQPTEVRLRPGGRAAVTFGAEAGATWELGVSVDAPAQVLAGTQEAGFGTSWVAGLFARLFFRGPADRSPEDPFRD